MSAPTPRLRHSTLVCLLFSCLLIALPPAHAAAPADIAAEWVIRDVQVAAGHVVFRAGSDSLDDDTLYSAPLAGGRAQSLTRGLPAATVEQVVVTPAGLVVFSARHASSGLRYLYSVPAAGGVPAILGPTYPTPRPPLTGSQLVFGPAGDRIIFAIDLRFPNAFELYSVPAAGGQAARLSPELLSAPTSIPAPFWVNSFAISDDGQLVVYRLDAGPLQRGVDLYAIPAAGGEPTLLGSGPRRTTDAFLIAPDNSHIAYATDTELHSVAADGDNNVLIASGFGIPFTITPDSARVVYALQGEGAAGATIRSFLVAEGKAETVAEGVRYASTATFRLTPDGGGVLYNDAAYTALLLAPVPGGAAPRTIIDTPAFPMVTFAADGAHAVFTAITPEGVALYSFALAAGGARRIDDPALSAGGQLLFDQVIAGGRAIYAARTSYDDPLRLYSVPVAGGASTPLTGALGDGQELIYVRGAADDGTVLFSSGSLSAPSRLRWRHLYSVPADGSAPPSLIESPWTRVYLPTVLR